MKDTKSHLISVTIRSKFAFPTKVNSHCKNTAKTQGHYHSLIAGTITVLCHGFLGTFSLSGHWSWFQDLRLLKTHVNWLIQCWFAFEINSIRNIALEQTWWSLWIVVSTRNEPYTYLQLNPCATRNSNKVYIAVKQIWYKLYKLLFNCCQVGMLANLWQSRLQGLRLALTWEPMTA